MYGVPSVVYVTADAIPAVTRAIDRAEELDLARRKPDPVDRRSVLVNLTSGGRVFLASLLRIMTTAAIGAGSGPEDGSGGVRVRKSRTEK